MPIDKLLLLSRVRDDARLSRTAKALIGISLISRMNPQSGSLNPSIATMCNDIGVKDARAVKASLKELQGLGYIEVRVRYGHTSDILLCLPPAKNVPPTKNAGDPLQKMYPHPLQKMYHKKEKENKKENIKEKKERKESFLPAEIGKTIDAEDLQKYLTVRKSKGASPLSSVSWNRLKKAAKDSGLTTEQALRLCIRKNWISINPEWKEVKAEALRLCVNPPKSRSSAHGGQVCYVGGRAIPLRGSVRDFRGLPINEVPFSEMTPEETELYYGG